MNWFSEDEFCQWERSHYRQYDGPVYWSSEDDDNDEIVISSWDGSTVVTYSGDSYGSRVSKAREALEQLGPTEIHYEVKEKLLRILEGRDDDVV